MLKFKEKI